MKSDKSQAAQHNATSISDVINLPDKATEGRLPDFLGIGAQKAGTSWLFDNLKVHPELFLPPEKEVHYFDRDFDKPFSFYTAKFAPAGRRITGEITPAYSVIDDTTIAFIKSHMPKLRLILILRNPMERAWSHAMMDLVSRSGQPYESLAVDDFARHFRLKSSISRGDYDQILERWLCQYPLEQLLVLNYEDIATQPQEFLRRVFVHLGVSIPQDWSTFPYGKIIHRGTGIKVPDACGEILREIYREPLQRLSQRLQNLALPPVDYEL